MSSNCRDFGDVHQGSVCVALYANSGEILSGQKLFHQGCPSAKAYVGFSAKLKMLHFVVDVDRETSYSNKDPHRRRRRSEDQV
jgi:hypothetical protein